VGVPTSCVEVGDALVGLLGDADAFKVLSDHQTGFSAIKLGKQLLIGRPAPQPRAEHFHELWVERQHVFATMLRAGGFDWRSVN
jgi:hypothetical protein